MDTVNHRELQAADRLEAINAMIAAHPDLGRQGFRFPKIGDRTKGEPELLELTRIQDDKEADPFHVYLNLRVLLPDGKEAPRPVRVNRNGGGAIMVVTINGKFVVVKQSRIPLGLRWTYEFPRGYSEAIDSARLEGNLDQLSIADLKLGVVAREFGEEVAHQAKVRFIGTLGNLALNSGPDATVTPVYVITSVIDQKLVDAKLKGEEEGIEAILVSGEDFERGIPQRYNDAITLAAYTLYVAWRSTLA